MNICKTVSSSFAFAVAGIAMSPLVFAAGPVLFESRFDAGAEGWTAFANGPGNPSHALEWVATDGNPGGAIRTLPPSDGDTSFFRGPDAIETALHNAIGGRISWDIATAHQPADTFFTSAADIQVRMDDLRIRRSFILAATDHPTYASYDTGFTTADGWNLFDGTTTRAATQPEIDSVLAGATSFIIRAEYWSSSTPDVAYLDNVVVTAVPEPSKLALLLAGMAFVGFAMRRRMSISC